MTRHQPSPGEHPAGAAGQEASTTEPVVERTVQVAARASAATPGPWGYLRPWGVICAPDLSDVAHCLHDPDALFIAHARTDIPWLLDQLAAEQAARLALEREQRELDGPGWVAVPRGWDRQLGLVLGHLGLSLAAKGQRPRARRHHPHPGGRPVTFLRVASVGWAAGCQWSSTARPGQPRPTAGRGWSMR